MTKIKTYKKEIPRISTAEMIEVDRLMIEKYHIELIQMMENAGRCLAILATKRFLKKKLSHKRVLVLAGTGGNGGGALVCARRLHNWGVKVEVYLTDHEDKITPVPLHQLGILRQMGVPIKKGDALPKKQKVDLIIDGIIGYNIKGNPYGLTKEMIDWTNLQKAPILSLDTPSGLDLTTGIIRQPTIQATATLTLALPKQGLFDPSALKIVGELYLGDISVPAELYQNLNLKKEVRKDIFSKSDVVLLKPSPQTGS